jgi:hypothetical protein
MYQSTRCPNPDSIVNPHHSKHLKSCTKEYKEQVKHVWKCHVGKTELKEVQYVFLKTQYLIPQFFFHQLCTLSHILPPKQTEETRSGTLPAYKHYQYK